MKGGKSKAGTSKKADAKLSVKASQPKAKAGKDPNKPKRPPSAFFVFMEGFRKEFMEKNPNNKKVSVVGKAGGDKWKSMSAAEKAPYEAEAAKRKSAYDKTMASYNKKQSDGAGKKSVKDDDEEEDSKSEVHDDEDAEEEESEEDE